MAYPTLVELGTALSYRLNDADHGQWELTELYQCLNSGRRRTIMEAECHIAVATATLVEDTAVYDLEPLTKVLDVRAGTLLKKQELGQLVLLDEDWDNDRGGLPTKWAPYSGATIRIHPAPSAAGVGIVETIAATPTAAGSDYAVGDVITIDDGTTLCRLVVEAVTDGAVTSIAIEKNDEGTAVNRGSGYTAGTGKATTAVTGSGEDCTVNISAVAGIRAYGVADVDDLGPGMISTVASAPTAGGTGYTATDLLTVTTGGTGGQVRISTVTDGVVTAVTLVSAGTGYTTGTGKATVGGTGTGCTVNITAVTDGTAHAIDEIPLGYCENALLLAAEEEARGARPSMTGSLERAEQCHTLWLEACKKIKAAIA